MTTFALFIIFFPLGIVILANAILVPNNQAMRVSIAMMGLGIFGLSVYWGLRAAGIIAIGQPPLVNGYLVALVLAAIGMYSVFGAPLFLELTRWRKK